MWSWSDRAMRAFGVWGKKSSCGRIYRRAACVLDDYSARVGSHMPRATAMAAATRQAMTVNRFARRRWRMRSRAARSAGDSTLGGTDFMRRTEEEIRESVARRKRRASIQRVGGDEFPASNSCARNRTYAGESPHVYTCGYPPGSDYPPCSAGRAWLIRGVDHSLTLAAT